MDIEPEDNCGYDYVEVRLEGGNVAGEKFCGNALPEDQTSTGNQMVIRFFSDGYIVGRGFRAAYTIIDGSGEGSISSSSS